MEISTGLPSVPAVSMDAVSEPIERFDPIESEPAPQRFNKLQKVVAAASTFEPLETRHPLPVDEPNIEVPKLAKTPIELPMVADVKERRPRRDPSPVTWSVATVVPVDESAGMNETKVEFQSNPAPQYPAAAVAGGIEGTVLLKLKIDRDGKVYRAEVLKSSGSNLLDRAALLAVLNWSGRPATRFGRPIEVEEVLPVRFRL